MIGQVGHALYKRAMNDGGDELNAIKLPSWAWLVVLANIVFVFIPISIFCGYTLRQLYPIFAIVEDENPPPYDPVSLNDDAASVPDLAEHGRAGPRPTKGQPQTVTSSLRSVNRLLYANGGLKANFRGFSIHLVQVILMGILIGIFSAGFGGIFTSVATLLASLTLVQFSTAWVHIIITPASRLHFWHRLPPFKRTFEATWKPVLLQWVALDVARWLPALLAFIVGLDLPNVNDINGEYGDGTGEDGKKPMDRNTAIALFFIQFVPWIITIFLVLPAHVVLVRVQASLLPEDQDTIIPFDRSFEGKIEPAIVGGKGYATITDAWSTFSRAAWRRLIILTVKIFLATLAAGALVIAIVIPQGIVIGQHAELVKGREGVRDYWF